MAWLWGRKHDHVWQTSLLERVGKIEERLDAVQESTQDMAQQMQRLARSVMKSTQAIDGLGETLKSRDAQEIERRNEVSELLIRVAGPSMNFVDELDASLSRVSETDPWRPVHEAWRRQQEMLLQQMGFQEIPVFHHPFDPTVAEGVGTVASDGDYPPYTVVQVVRRGYHMNGQIWRKAQVVTVRSLAVPDTNDKEL